jgi:hypothetical protein
MTTNPLNEASLKLPLLYRVGDEDAKQHWFLCDAIWNAYKTIDDTQLVEFQMTLQGREL